MSDDDTYEVPLQDQRVFGAGIKRKRVKFVPSTSTSSITSPTVKAPGRSASELYLSLVLPNEPSFTENNPSKSPTLDASSKDSRAITEQTHETAKPVFCDICKLLLSSPNDTTTTIEDSPTIEASDQNQRRPSKPRPHEASLAHQVCLEHSHPPSHLDRNRKGLTYLSAYGWDPDSRLGLGAQGQGIQFPIKTKPKDDKLGIGVVLPEEGQIPRKKKLEKLDAGKVRKMYEKDKRHGERLREMFYRNDDVERYLGGG